MSDPNSSKGTLFKEKLRANAIKYRDCEPEDIVISDCLSRIKQEIENDENATLIGSSLGGLLAAKTALENSNVKQLILLNPAIIPPSVDISKIQGMPQRILTDMQDIRLFKEKIASKIFILLGTEDDVVPNKWGQEFASAQKATVKLLKDDHSFTNKLNQLPE
ncbi:MAG: YqiA/YcfP family alpha/beta fold hydrolase, partial [Candidatus Hodarchaeales archaeon]